MFCSRCGTEIHDASIFCKDCGYKIGSEDIKELDDKTNKSTYKEETNMNSNNDVTGLMIGSIILSFLSLVFFPPILGISNIILCSNMQKKNKKTGNNCMIGAIICMCIGMFSGALMALI